MGSLKINYTINDHIFTVDDVISKSKNQLQSQWSLAIGELIFKCLIYILWKIKT